MGAPPSINLMGEIIVFVCMFNWLLFSSFIVGLISFLSAAYRLFLFSFTQHGKINFLRVLSIDGECKEHLLLSLHSLPILLGVPYILELLCCCSSLIFKA
jgi:NADH-ubiquinone oxidoreductase chain 4